MCSDWSNWFSRAPDKGRERERVGQKGHRRASRRTLLTRPGNGLRDCPLGLTLRFVREQPDGCTQLWERTGYTGFRTLFRGEGSTRAHSKTRQWAPRREQCNVTTARANASSYAHLPRRTGDTATGAHFATPVPVVGSRPRTRSVRASFITDESYGNMRHTRNDSYQRRSLRTNHGDAPPTGPPTSIYVLSTVFYQ